MTSKTIAIPLELADRIAGVYVPKEHRDGVKAIHELRALLAAPEAPRQSRVATGQWRIPVNGDWFYGTKAACERERAEYESTFTDLDREEAGVVRPEQIYVDSLSPDHSGVGAGVVLPDTDKFIEEILGLSTRKIASGDYQSFGASCAARAIDKVKELNQ